MVLLKLKVGEPSGAFEVPVVVPIMGGISSALLVVFRIVTGDIQAPLMGSSVILRNPTEPALPRFVCRFWMVLTPDGSSSSIREC